jgi:phosphatidylglycerol lysyltransferase
MAFFAARPRAMIAPTFWIFLDWLFTVAVLYTACRAVGADVSYGDAIIAFAVAIVVAVASFVPGGVGVLEVTLAGMFASVGVPAEQSVLAIFVFRVAFYVIPVLLALVLARGAFRSADGASIEAALR